MNPATFDSLSDDERTAIIGGQDGFMETITASGELVGTHAVADPSQSAVAPAGPGR